MGFPVLLGMLLAGMLSSMGCGPRVAPEGPGLTPGASARDLVQASSAAEPGPERSVRPAAREVVIGEMCPSTAAGRPAVLPLFVRSLYWSAEHEDASLSVETRAARLFSVLAWNGQRAGLFSVAGASDVGLDRRAAVGAYAGSSPCVLPGETGTQGTAIGACTESQSGSAPAVAVLEPAGGPRSRQFDEDPDPATFVAGGACLVSGTEDGGERLLVDIDGDGQPESFAADGFLDPVRAPADEVTAVPRSAGSATCAPAFAVRHVLPPGDPRHFQGMDLLGVIDLDGDGRKELVMLYRYAERRTWAIYSAVNTVARLDLVGEAEPWPER